MQIMVQTYLRDGISYSIQISGKVQAELWKNEFKFLISE